MTPRRLTPWIVGLALAWVGLGLCPQGAHAQESPSEEVSLFDWVRKKSPSTTPLTGLGDIVGPDVMGEFSLRAGARVSGFSYRFDDDPNDDEADVEVDDLRYDVFAAASIGDSLEFGLQVPVRDIDLESDDSSGSTEVEEVDIGDAEVGIKGVHRIEYIRLGVFSLLTFPTAEDDLADADPSFFQQASDNPDDFRDNIASRIGATASVVVGPFEVLGNALWYTRDDVDALVYRVGGAITPLPVVRAGLYWEGTELEGSVNHIGSVEANLQVWVPPVFVDVGGSVTVLTDGWEQVQAFEDVEIFGSTIAIGVAF